MTFISIRQFRGEIPRLPAERLPEGAAREAVNCNFLHGELRSLAGPGIQYATTRAVRSLFTDDGLRFFTWDIPTRAYRAPTIDDVHQRVYFANGTGLWVAQSSEMKAASLNPGPPEHAWKVGVSAPSSAPELEVVLSNVWRGDPDAVLKIETVCKAEGGATLKTGEVLSVEEVSKWTEYLVTVPENPCGGATGEKQKPVNGWVQIPGDFSGYVKERARESGDDLGDTGSEKLVLYENGKYNIYYTINAKGELSTVNNNSPSAWNQAQVIFYKGMAWYPTSTLYTALVEGTVEQQVEAATGVKSSLGFLATVINESTGAVYYQTEPVFSKEEDGRYRIKISYEAMGQTETVAYVTTFQNIWGEESKASPAALIDIAPTQTVILKQTHTPNPAEVPVAGMNVYRTYGNTASYTLATVSPVTSVDDTWKWDDPMGGIKTTTGLKSLEWDTPPDSPANFAYVGNGFFALSSGKDLWFSEPYHPHAWPYAMTFPYGIVGVIPIEGGVLVTTQAQPYLVYGPHPEQMTQQALNAEQAGIGWRAMTQVEGSAIYASRDGLVSVAGGQASVESSQQLYAREDWRGAWQKYFTNLMLNAHDGMVIGFVDPSVLLQLPSTPDGFLIRLDHADSYLVHLRLGSVPLGMNISETTDTLYVGFSKGFAAFAEGALLETIWHSQDFVCPAPVVLGAAIVRGSGNWTISIYADEKMIYSRSVTLTTNNWGEVGFRLPACGRAKCWSVRFQGSGTLRSFEMGASFAELQHG